MIAGKAIKGKSADMIEAGPWNPSLVDTRIETKIIEHFKNSDSIFIQHLLDSGIPRSEIFINTKIYNTCYEPKLVKLQLEKSLEGQL